MKRFSWEIILAGFVFIAISAYLINLADERNRHSRAEAPAPPAPPTPEEVRVIDMQQLSELEKLKELRELDKLNDAEKLESLRSLARFMPEDVRDEVLTEIDQVIRELSEEDFSIQIDTNDNLVIVNRDFKVVDGEWSKTSPGVYTFQKEFDASALNDLVLDLPFGSITVIGVDSDKATFTLQASGQVDSESDLREQLSIQSDISSDEAAFEIVSKRSWSIRQNIHLQATISVPEKLKVVAHTKGGHIKSTNIEGDQVYETAGGHITLDRLTGEVAAKTLGGHISVTDSEGEFSIETKGGHLKATNIRGKTVLLTYGGNIDVQAVDGEIVAETKGGNVTINQTDQLHEISAETFAGNVTIIMPSNSRAEVALEANSGVELNGFSVNGSVSKNKVSGTLTSGGGPRVAASTKYGKVILKSNG